METIQIVLYVASACAGILATAVPSIITVCKAAKDRKTAKTEADKAAADLAIKNEMINLIGDAENLYAVVDTALKAMGGSAGSVKKETVMSRLHQYALDNGFAFDKEKWSAEIDATVAVTKVVNAK